MRSSSETLQRHRAETRYAIGLKFGDAIWVKLSIAIRLQLDDAIGLKLSNATQQAIYLSIISHMEE